MPTSYYSYKAFLEKKHPCIFKEYETFPNLYDCGSGDRWADIEAALCIDYDEFFSSIVADYYPNLSDESDSRWYNIDVEIENLTRFINDFTGRCFFQWLILAEQAEAEADLSLEPDTIFINFNYTNTLQRLYGIPESSILHIHGSLSNLNGANVLWQDVFPNTSDVETIEALGPIVEGDKWSSGYIREEIQFGATGITPDGVLKELIKQYQDDDFFGASIEPVLNTLLEFVENSTKNTQANYNRLRDFLAHKDIDEVVIMGVSLGEADDSYYSDIIIPLLRNVKWTFMKHDEVRDGNAINNFIKRYDIKNYSIIPW